MRKIPTVFVRDEPTNRKHVRNEVAPGCEWVLAGEGRATRKWDGTCCLIDNDLILWARREVKPGKEAPEGFVLVETDETTGKSVGWVRCENTKEWERHKEAFLALIEADQAEPGTYELCGPKVNGNPEGFDRHVLISHARAQLIPLAYPVDYEGLRHWFTTAWPHEGIVWHHPDGRMAKLKVRDFPASRTGGPT